VRFPGPVRSGPREVEKVANRAYLDRPSAVVAGHRYRAPDQCGEGEARSRGSEGEPDEFLPCV
jgi:hypothetical protein